MRLAVEVEDRGRRVGAEAQGPGLVGGAADRHVLAEIERAVEQVRVDLEPGAEVAQLGLEPVQRLLVGLRQIEPHLAVLVEDAVLRDRQVLGGEPEIEGMRGDPVERLFREPLQEARQALAADLHPVRLADHLDVAEGVIPVVGAEVEVVEAERLLEPGRVRGAGDRQHRRVVVPHVVAADLTRPVGESLRVGVAGRAQHQERRGESAAGHHHDVAGEHLGRLAALDLDAGDRPAGRIGEEPLDVGIGHQREVVVRRERGIDAGDLRIRLAVGDARIAVEGIAADAGGVRQRLAVPLVEAHPDRKVERVMALALQPVEQLLDPGLVGDRRVGVGLA